MWYTGFGGIICCVVANLACLLCGTNKLEDINPDLISPVLHRFLPARRVEVISAEMEPLKKEKNKDELITVKKSLDVVE